MRHFSKPYRIAIIGLCVTIALIVVLGRGNGFVVGQHENQTDTRMEIGLWTRGTLIEQTFLASRNNLARIDVWIDSYRPFDSPFLECRLFEVESQQLPREFTPDELRQHLKEVRSKRLNGWLLSPHMFNRFEFEPIPDSQGKRYLVSIQSPELKRGGSSIMLASPRKRLDDELFLVDRTVKEGDLAFRAIYAQPRFQVLRNSFARIALQKPIVLSSPTFYYLLFVSYCVVFVFLVCLL